MKFGTCRTARLACSLHGNGAIDLDALNADPRRAIHKANAHGDWEERLLAADRLEASGDAPLAVRLEALVWRKAKQDPQATVPLAALRLPEEEEWPQRRLVGPHSSEGWRLGCLGRRR